MPVLIAVLFALVIAAFFVSRRAGLLMLAGVSVAVAGMFAWIWHTAEVAETRRDVIPIDEIEVLDSRTRGTTTDYLFRNRNERWTLTAIHSEMVARLDDGTILDRREFTHRVDIPPQQARWQTLRYFGLEIGLEYEWRIIGTEGTLNP